MFLAIADEQQPTLQHLYRHGHSTLNRPFVPFSQNTLNHLIDLAKATGLLLFLNRKPRSLFVRGVIRSILGERHEWPIPGAIAVPVEMLESWLLLISDGEKHQDEASLPPFARKDQKLVGLQILFVGVKPDRFLAKSPKKSDPLIKPVRFIPSL